MQLRLLGSSRLRCATDSVMYSVYCIHSSQKCVPTRQITDKIFQIFAALAHPRMHGLWSCEGRAFPEFLQLFPQTFTKGASLMLRRQGCLACTDAIHFALFKSMRPLLCYQRKYPTVPTAYKRPYKRPSWSTVLIVLCTSNKIDTNSPTPYQRCHSSIEIHLHPRKASGRRLI